MQEVTLDDHSGPIWPYQWVPEHTDARYGTVLMDIQMLLSSTEKEPLHVIGIKGGFEAD